MGIKTTTSSILFIEETRCAAETGPWVSADGGHCPFFVAGTQVMGHKRSAEGGYIKQRPRKC